MARTFEERRLLRFLLDNEGSGLEQMSASVHLFPSDQVLWPTLTCLNAVPETAVNPETNMMDVFCL